jgi:alpha-tubulin suppressor-like RCC1 family protein
MLGFRSISRAAVRTARRHGVAHACGCAAVIPLVASSCLDWDRLSSEHGTQPVVEASCGAYVVAGDTHSCARGTSGALWCWGDNRYGQLGTGDTLARTRPAAVDLAGHEVSKIYVAAGYGELSSDRAAYSCALTTLGELLCWGDDRFGQLGLGDTSPRSVPTLLESLPAIERVAAGAGHTCAQTSSGALLCWGNNQYGQLGNGTTDSSDAPVDVEGLSSGVDGLSAAGYHTCAKKTDHSARCWGSNSSGQLGIAGMAQAASPQTVEALGNDVARIAVGGEHTCAIRLSGAVRCFGDNRFAQLGVGDTSEHGGPVDVSLPSGATQLYLGRAHSCALLTDASLWCWGINRFGELGTGDSSASMVPQRVGIGVLDDGVSAASAGGGHSCAVRVDGAVFCWGNNLNGQLGVEGVSGSNAPEQVMGACE